MSCLMRAFAHSITGTTWSESPLPLCAPLTDYSYQSERWALLSPSPALSAPVSCAKLHVLSPMRESKPCLLAEPKSYVGAFSVLFWCRMVLKGGSCVLILLFSAILFYQYRIYNDKPRHRKWMQMHLWKIPFCAPEAWRFTNTHEGWRFRISIHFSRSVFLALHSAKTRTFKNMK